VLNGLVPFLQLAIQMYSKNELKGTDGKALKDKKLIDFQKNENIGIICM